MELLTTKQAAKYLGMSTAFLERDRWAGAKVPFVRVGSRTVRYLKSNLRVHPGTSDTRKIYELSRTARHTYA